MQSLSAEVRLVWLGQKKQKQTGMAEKKRKLMWLRWLEKQTTCLSLKDSFDIIPLTLSIRRQRFQGSHKT